MYVRADYICHVWEVYNARGARLDREIALKVRPSSLTQDAERLSFRASG